MEAVCREILIAVAVLEVVLLCWGAMSRFLAWGYTFAEAAASALVTPVMILSFLYQTGFILGAAAWVPVAEACVCAASAWSLWAGRRYLAGGWVTVRGFLRVHWLPAGMLMAVWGYLGARAILAPLFWADGDALAQVAAWQAGGSFFAVDGEISPVPVNVMVLPHLFLRLGTHTGVGLFGWLAYLAIGFATYSLARRHAWPPTAFTVTLVTVSLPRLVLLAPSPGLEIVPAAAAVFSLLILYRLVERPRMLDLGLLVLAVCFCMPAEVVGFLLPAVLLLLSAVVLVRRHGTLIWGRALRFHPWATLSLVAPTLIFSQIWLFTANFVRTGIWNGGAPAAGFSYNGDGLQGALANLMRYLLESAHFTQPVDRFFLWAVGFRLTDVLQRIWELAGRPLFDGLGATEAFRVSWPAQGPGVWFGPFAFALILPALAYALFRGSRRLKATSLALAGYVYLICMVCAWTPANARFFTPVVACGGFCSGFFLPPWRLTRAGMGAIQGLSLLLMVYGAACLTWPFSV
jgi:hypothetical protein